MSSNKKEWAAVLEVSLVLVGFPCALLFPFAVWYLTFGNIQVSLPEKLAIVSIACIETVVFIFTGSVMDAMLATLVKRKIVRIFLAFILMVLVVALLNSFWLKDVYLLITLSTIAGLVLTMYSKLVESRYTRLLNKEKS